MARTLRRLVATAMLAAGLVAGGGSPGQATAGTAPLELLFETPHLEGLRPGATLTYAHLREAAEGTRIGPDFQRQIRLETGTEETPGVGITMDAEGTPRELERFRGVPGNPMLMVFLENTVRAVNRATGGSPFYLRNRVIEALRERLEAQPMILTLGTARLPARSLTVMPFEGDENADRLGAFEDLQLRFILAEEAPGMLLAMIAEAGPRVDPQTGETTGAGTPGGETVYYEEIRLDLPR